MNRTFASASAASLLILTACSKEIEAPAPQQITLQRYVSPPVSSVPWNHDNAITIGTSVRRHPGIYGAQTDLIGTYLDILMDKTAAGAVRVSNTLSDADIHAFFERPSDKAYLDRAKAWAELESSLNTDEAEVRGARLDLYLVEIPNPVFSEQELNAAKYLLEKTGLPVNENNRRVIALRVNEMLPPPRPSVAAAEAVPN